MADRIKPYSKYGLHMLDVLESISVKACDYRKARMNAIKYGKNNGLSFYCRMKEGRGVITRTK